MRVLRKNVIAGLLLVLPMTAALVGAGCGSRGGKEALPEPTATASAAVATPSPFPTARPVLDAATRFGAVHTAALPARNASSDWNLQQLIPGSRLFLVAKPGRDLPCDGCQFPPGDPANPGKLAFWNVGTGALEEFRTLQPGDGVPVSASDGRFLSWVEGCHNPMGGPWNLYAMDLATREIWHVDTDFATTSGDYSLSTCPLGIAIANGRLVYSTSIANLSGTYVDEVRTYDLAKRTGSKLTLTGGDIAPINVGCSGCGQSEGGLVTRFFPLYASGGQIVWIGEDQEICPPSVTQATPQVLYVTDVSNGDTKFLACKDESGKDGLLRFLTGSSQGRGGGAWEDYVQVTHDFVLWVPRPENVAMAYDLRSGDLIEVGDHSVDFLAADDAAIYWTCSDSQLRWVDLPQP